MKKNVLLLSFLSVALGVAGQSVSTGTDVKSEAKMAVQYYTDRGIPYKVSIINGKDNYVASYDNHGTMLHSKLEQYDGVLPNEVHATLKSITGWRMNKSQQTVVFEGNNMTTTLYRVNLRKRGHNRVLFFNSNGDITNRRLEVQNRVTALQNF
jgi:hypothetical protein